MDLRPDQSIKHFNPRTANWTAPMAPPSRTTTAQQNGGSAPRSSQRLLPPPSRSKTRPALKTSSRDAAEARACLRTSGAARKPKAWSTPIEPASHTISSRPCPASATAAAVMASPRMATSSGATKKVSSIARTAPLSNTRTRQRMVAQQSAASRRCSPRPIRQWHQAVVPRSAKRSPTRKSPLCRSALQKR